MRDLRGGRWKHNGYVPCIHSNSTTSSGGFQDVACERAVMRDVSGGGQDHYYLLKDLYTVTGLAGSNGVLEEAYVYDTYGHAVIYEWPLGDLDRDGDVDTDDQAYLSSHQSGSGTPTDYPFLDLDREGDADNDDAGEMQTGQTPAALTSSGLDNRIMLMGRLM